MRSSICRLCAGALEAIDLWEYQCQDCLTIFPDPLDWGNPEYPPSPEISEEEQ